MDVDYEIWLVNDGSKDNTLNILRELSNKVKIVELIKNNK